MRDNIRFRIWELPNSNDDYVFSNKVFEIACLTNENHEDCIIRVVEGGEKKDEEIRILHHKSCVVFGNPLNLYITGFVYSKNGRYSFTRIRFVTDEYAQEHRKTHKDKFKNLEVE